ncbi:hypothetical protein DPMN_135012 [Dreissena polymorpha]|uniref:Uncharacterized protein n=1 Tax=Dreissena polymorpha TaxID=45954 RepID=A0A9D4JFE2_DREPO|nr:hypothetical protein DPMN_135012 [Dreissena polymorpha]
MEAAVRRYIAPSRPIRKQVSGISDTDGNLLTESAALSALTGLYESPPILKAEVEEALRSIKAGKSPGHEGEATTAALAALCQTIWDEKWLKEWAQTTSKCARITAAPSV